MNVTIRPGRAVGTVAAPPSKSMAHRLLICAGLSEGVSHIRGVDYNEDILATIDCLRAMGAVCSVTGDTVTVEGIDLRSTVPSGILNCRESGSTLRFFIPMALLCGQTVEFTGTRKLLSRPLGIYEELCAKQGDTFIAGEDGLRVRGSLTGGIYELPGNISSQFITGLLFALPLAPQDSRIVITTALESRSYIDLTLHALHAFGIRAQRFVRQGGAMEARTYRNVRTVQTRRHFRWRVAVMQEGYDPASAFFGGYYADAFAKRQLFL